MNGIFSESSLGVIGKVKKGFLWSAVCILIGGFVLGAILILMGTYSDVTGKILTTMGILALVLFVGVNNFIRMEKGTKAIQILALVGLITGLFAAILGIVLAWDVLPTNDIITGSCTAPRNDPYYCDFVGASMSVVPSIWAKILSVLTSLAGAGFWLSNVMSIKETIKVVKPLKITSVVCEIYCAIYAVVMVFISSSDIYRNEVFTRMLALSGLAAFAFVVTALAAWIISRTSGKKQAVNSDAVTAPKTDAELRAEIEEKVRREMIEKEVRERMEAQMKSEITVSIEPVSIKDGPSSEESAPIMDEPVDTLDSSDDSQGTGLSSGGQF